MGNVLDVSDRSDVEKGLKASESEAEISVFMVVRGSDFGVEVDEVEM